LSISLIESEESEIMWLVVLRTFAACLLSITLVSSYGCGGKDSGETTVREELAKAKNTSNPALRAKRLVAVASKQRDAGDASGAESSLKMALTSCDKIEDIDDRLKALNGVAEALAQTGDKTEAEAVLKQVKGEYPKIADGLSKVQIVTKMAEIYGRYLGKPRTAVRFLGDVASSAEAIPDAALRIEAMSGIAVAYHHFDATAEYEGQMQKTLDAARAVEDDRARTEGLLTVANGLSELKKDDQAKQLIAEADKLIDTIAEPHSRAYALVSLARAWDAAGEKASAKEAISRADDVADETDSSLRGPLKEKIAATRKEL
jgi:tetratricopeptide (TPR) repeat protein